MRRLSLDRLQAFATVVELGSFSAAAARLELSQPAISLQVREQEKHGISLKPAMELGSVEAIKEIVGAGLGCSIVPRMALPNPGSRRRTIARPLNPRLSRKLAIVLRRDKPLQRGLREVVNAIKTFAAEFAAPAANT